jgi:hypothetical protein
VGGACTENEVKLAVVDCSMPASVKPSKDASWLWICSIWSRYLNSLNMKACHIIFLH